MAVVAVVGVSLGVTRSLTPSPSSAPGTVASSAAPVAVHTFNSLPPRLHSSPSPIPTRPLPNGLEDACGKPGSKLIVRIVPVTIPHRICNLSGVTVQSSDGMSVAVPTAGSCSAVMPGSVKAAAGQAPRGLTACTARQGDVTISRP